MIKTYGYFGWGGEKERYIKETEIMIHNAFNNEKLTKKIGHILYYHLTSEKTRGEADERRRVLHSLGYLAAIIQRKGTKVYVIYVGRR